MPEITDAELRQFQLYQRLGLPDEIQTKLRKLEKDNRKQRIQIQKLGEQKPKDGQVVVSKADADLLPKYKELGDIKDLKAKLEKGEEAIATAEQLTAKESATKFSKVAGIAEEAVGTLLAIPALKGAKFEVKKAKVKNDKGVEEEKDAGFITLAGEGQQALSFTDALEKVPELKGLRMAQATEQGGGGVRYVQQGGNPKNGGSSIYDRIRERASEQKKQADEKPAVKSIEERLGMKL